MMRVDSHRVEGGVCERRRGKMMRTVLGLYSQLSTRQACGSGNLGVQTIMMGRVSSGTAVGAAL